MFDTGQPPSKALFPEERGKGSSPSQQQPFSRFHFRQESDRCTWPIAVRPLLKEMGSNRRRIQRSARALATSRSACIKP